jgi:hypothetical protein
VADGSPVCFYSTQSRGKRKRVRSVKPFSFGFSGFAIVYIVGRYKQCLDFSVTIHFYHFLACWLYSHQHPNQFSWHVTQFLAIVIMTILSEHFSKKSELQNIPLGNRVDL